MSSRKPLDCGKGSDSVRIAPARRAGAIRTESDPLPQSSGFLELIAELHVALVATCAHLTRRDRREHRTSRLHRVRAVREATLGGERTEFREAVVELRRIEAPHPDLPQPRRVSDEAA